MTNLKILTVVTVLSVPSFAWAQQSSTPIPPEVAVGVLIAREVGKELTKPYPFCRVIRLWRKKAKCR